MTALQARHDDMAKELIRPSYGTRRINQANNTLNPFQTRINNISSIGGRVIRVLPVIGILVYVGSGIHENVQNGQHTERILNDVLSDVVFGIGFTLIPGPIGTIVGVVAPNVEIGGQTTRQHYRDFNYNGRREREQIDRSQWDNNALWLA